jgi:hypothetical protein
VPDSIHLSKKGRLGGQRQKIMWRTWSTRLISDKELYDALDEYLCTLHVEEVVIPRRDGRSHGYAFVSLSWTEASKVNPSDICSEHSGFIDLNLLQICHRELHSKV